MITMYGKPCAPSEPLFWLHQRILCDTLPGARVPKRDVPLLNILVALEDVIYTWKGTR